MTEQHPITPSPELIRQLLDDDDFPFRTGTHGLLSITKDRLNHVITQAARWGADQELEACIAWMMQMGYWGDDGKAIPALRAARRPKQPSLKEQALEALKREETDSWDDEVSCSHHNLPSSAVPWRPCPMTDHPITPPPHKHKQWEDDILNERENVDFVLDCAWKDGFRAGADAELEECCDYIRDQGRWFATPELRLAELRAARRPKPLSPKEEGSQVLENLINTGRISDPEYQALRHALEQLND